jgi:hypothetical protein
MREGRAMDDEKIKLGVLWKNLSRKGNKPYLSGRVQQDSFDAAVQLMRDGGRLLVLSNTKRPDKQDTDCVLFVVPEREPQGAHHARDAASPRRATPPADRSTPRPSTTTRATR